MSATKRSRFDQTEPEPKRSSRFDRRSRSPAPRHSESRRSRSPGTAKDRASLSSPKPASDPAAAAAAAAARINAQIQAKKGIQTVDVPPIRSAMSSSPTNGASTPKTPAGTSTANINGEMYIADGDYIKDIEVNDLRNRYTLTKGATQKMIKEETGADVTTRGNYYPDKSLATAANPPLYLHVTSTTKIGLEKAVEKIEELMKQELPNLVDERRFRRREPEQVERDEYGRRKWPDEKIPIDMEPLPGFNLRAQVVGPGGQYVKHVQQETGCRVQIKGRGSGFFEQGTQSESNESMYLHVAGPNPNEVQRAKELCIDLLDNVRREYEAHKANPPPQRSYNGGGGGGGGGYQGGYGGGGGHQERQNSYGNHNSGGYGSGYGVQSPTTPAPPGTSERDASNTTPGAPPGGMGDYATQLNQYYAQYGGYQNYVAYYQYYQQQAALQQHHAGGMTPSQGQGSPAPPPSAPPGEAAGAAQPPPPPPPGGSPPGMANGGGYNAMPPPPGL